MKKGSTKDYADLLRQLETKRLAKGKHNCYLGIRWRGEARGRNRGGEGGKRREDEMERRGQ